MEAQWEHQIAGGWIVESAPGQLGNGSRALMRETEAILWEL